MIFPSVRISDLVRERDARAAAFDRSRSEMVRVLREEARPINILKRHPALLMGAAASVMSVLGLSRFIGGGILGALGNGHVNGDGRHRSDLVGKLIAIGTGLATRKFGVIGATALRFAITSLLKKRRGD